MVDVGGRRLHLYCVGSGSPTVVFESGLGEGAYAWALVQPAVGRQYRACAYDRSGIAFSDPTPGPRSVASLVRDLHELLARSGERGPYLLVGHSLGGLFVRRYAKKYPDEVAALVLLDSSHEDGRRTASREVSEAQAQALAARAVQMKAWHASGEFEKMTFHDKLPRSMTKVLTPLSASASWWDARFAENSLPDAQDDLSPEQRRLDVPLLVITATKWPTPRGYPPLAWKQHMETRMRLQAELASRSARSKQVIVPTEHHVQFEDPRVVIDWVLRLARDWRTWPESGDAAKR
jgi:pimeloyl-ACP methyl ester carboxylesterase